MHIFFQHVFVVKQKLTENKKVYVHEERERLAVAIISSVRSWVGGEG
jgi:hypothetical protein